MLSLRLNFTVFHCMHNFSQENDKTLPLLLVSLGITAILMLAVFYLPGQSLKQPPLQVELPDLTQVEDIKQRKQMFFDYLRPLVKRVNSSIREDRAALMAIIDRFEESGELGRSKQQKLLQLANRYRLDSPREMSIGALVKELRLRVNVIPSALVLAQAANESAWGRSRFAVQGNNLFGQWCFELGCGIVPKGRPEGKKYEVATFESPLESVRSYMMNLNTFSAYESLRKRRQEMLRKSGSISGIKLAEELVNYSTRREEYVREIQAMIRQNSLE